MNEWKIYSINGVERAQVKELELHDEWMAECYLTVTVKDANPVRFQIGDYIDYRGERYCINYDPRVLKKARRGTHGEGFIYENIKFVSDPQSKIVGCDFTDIVLDDNQMHYTGLPTFPFYCESVDDLLDRVQACLEELYPGRFILIGLNTSRNAQRGSLVGRQQAFIDAYKQYVDPTGAERTLSYGKTSVAMTVDNITCWEALTKINSEFDLNFIQRGNVVIAGTDGVFTSSTFRYGKGNGLYEIERISEEGQQVVTRLKAYGSEENLPNRYYAELNLQVFAHVESIKANYATSGLHYANFILDLDYFQKYFTEISKSYPGNYGGKGDYNFIVKLQANGITVKGYITKTYSSNRCEVYCEYTGVNPEDDRDEPDEAAMNAFSEAIKQGDLVYFVGGVEKSAFPLANKNYATENLPNNMAVSRLMLPGFPNQSLYNWVKEHGGTDCDDATGKATINGFTGYFSKEKHRPWIQSLKADEYGIRPSNIYFDGNNDTENIHPTLEGMKYLGNDVDKVVSAEQITDNGVYGEGNVPNFTITLPNLGFDLAEYYEEGATIDMKDGMCGSRSFKMANRPTKNNLGQWECRVERVKDDSLDLWFPYKDFQIKTGDHYVLTGIKLPDEYVSAASEKLLYAAIDALGKNDTTRFTYQPRIDEIWMARQHDEAIGRGETSIHDTIHAGDIFLFADEDLDIDEGIIIDVLTIRERGNGELPTYEVTLRDEKQVSTIQRMIDKAVSGNSVSGGGSGGGGGYTSKQIQSLIENYGSEQFLSRLNNDIAEGRITFEKGFTSLFEAWFGDYHREHPIAGDELDTGAAITPDGAADLISLIVRDCVKGDLSVEQAMRASEIVFRNILRSPGGSPDMEGTGIHMDASTGVISTDGLVVRGWAMFRKLIYNYLEIMEQDYQFSGGGDIEEVVDNGDGTYTCYMHKEKEGRHPAIAENDILFGKVDDETGDDGYEYYTSWMRVHSMTLNDGMERDVMVVSLWADNMVPGGKNFAPKDFMTVARRGNTTNPLRQSYWELSGTDHRLTHYWNVTQPILHAENYALALGILPSVLDDEGVLPSQIRDKNMPSLYVNTIFYEHAHKIKWPATIVRTDRGQWVNNPTIVVDGTTVSEPYHFRTYTRALWLQYRNDASYSDLTDEQLHAKMMQEWKVDLEISRVWNNGILWECLVDGTTQEPHWNCTDWTPVGGNTIYRGEITTSNGRTFRNGNVDTILTMRVWYGDEEITDTILNIVDYAIVWKRYTGYNTTTEEFEQTSEDLSWVATEVGSDGEPISAGDKTNRIKVLRGDMGSGWMLSYRQALIESTVSFSASGQVVTMPADYVF
jgi:hypothetical protein